MNREKMFRLAREVIHYHRTHDGGEVWHCERASAIEALVKALVRVERERDALKETLQDKESPDGQ